MKKKKKAANGTAVSAAQAKVRKMAQQAALSWEEAGMESGNQGLRIVVLKHMFSPEDFKAGKCGGGTAGWVGVGWVFGCLVGGVFRWLALCLFVFQR